MKSYCLKWRKYSENINLKVSSTSNGKAIILSKRATCGSKKSRFIKNQEAKGLLSNLGVRTPFSKVPILGDIFFEVHLRWTYKMNEMVNKFLLVVHKFLPEMHLKQPWFAYSACEPFTKNKERIQKFKKTRDTNYIYKNEFDKTFQRDMTYEDLKDLARRTASDKVLRDKAFNIAKNPECDRDQRGLNMVYKFFDKKSAGSGVNMYTNNERRLDLAEELQKSITRKLKKK